MLGDGAPGSADDALIVQMRNQRTGMSILKIKANCANRRERTRHLDGKPEPVADGSAVPASFESSLRSFCHVFLVQGKTKHISYIILKHIIGKIRPNFLPFLIYRTAEACTKQTTSVAGESPETRQLQVMVSLVYAMHYPLHASTDTGASPRLPGIPIVALTGSESNAFLVAPLALGER